MKRLPGPCCRERPATPCSNINGGDREYCRLLKSALSLPRGVWFRGIGIMVSIDSWFGGLDQPVDIYCERTTAAWNAEPLNAISNFAFFIAAWAVWRLQKQRPNTEIAGPI